MLQRIRHRLKDMKTIAALCQGAERHALSEGEREPGAEHFLLAALELPDGSARRAFERIRADPEGVGAALREQHRAALRGIGVDPSGLDAADDLPPVAPGAGLYRAQASGQAVMQRLTALRGERGDAPLAGAHVIEAIAAAPQGITARTLRTMGIDAAALAAAAREEAGALPRS